MQSSVAVSSVCFALFFYVIPSLCAQDTQSSLLAHARDEAAHGRYSPAKVEIQAAIAVDESKAEPWYQLGLLDGQMADYRDAEQAFRHALTLDSHSAKTHCRLGQTLVAEPDVKEDWESAVAEFRAALQLDPDYPEAESLLGLGLMHLGDTAAAITTLRHAIQLHPAQASAHLNLALILQEQPGGQDDAVEEYRAALAAKPDAPETAASLGKLLLQMGRLSEAEEAFRRALRLDPDLQDAHYGLARILKTNKELGEANIELGIVAALERRKPDDALAVRLSNEALQLAAKGDLSGAIVGLRKSILLKPDYGIGKYNLGLVLADSGDFAGARQQLIDAVSFLPAQATVWFDLGRVFDKLGEPCNALESLFWANQLSRANPRFTAEWNRLRAANSSQKPPNTAVSNEVEGHACTTPPGRPVFGAMSDTFSDRAAFAKELRAQDDLTGASGELLRALELKPNAIDARTELAEIYASQSLWDRAFEEYRKVLLVAGDGDASTHLAFGEALLKADHAAEAAEQFSKVLKLEPHSSNAQAALYAAHRALSHP